MVVVLVDIYLKFAGIPCGFWALRAVCCDYEAGYNGFEGDDCGSKAPLPYIFAATGLDGATVGPSPTPCTYRAILDPSVKNW